jgi:hypothetical protein
MLAVDPDERPASARELMEAIEECRLKLTGGNETARRSFFAELQRRNVYKVAVAYAVVAWLLMQVASQFFPFFEIPNWAVRLVVLLLIIGFPIALIIAWRLKAHLRGSNARKLRMLRDSDPAAARGLHCAYRHSALCPAFIPSWGDMVRPAKKGCIRLRFDATKSIDVLPLGSFELPHAAKPRECILH